MAVKISELTRRFTNLHGKTLMIADDANGTFASEFDRLLPKISVTVPTETKDISYVFKSICSQLMADNHEYEHAVAAAYTSSGGVQKSGPFTAFISPTAVRFMASDGTQLYAGQYVLSSDTIALKAFTGA